MSLCVARTRIPFQTQPKVLKVQSSLDARAIARPGVLLNWAAWLWPETGVRWARILSLQNSSRGFNPKAVKNEHGSRIKGRGSSPRSTTLREQKPTNIKTMKTANKTIGRLIVGCVFACCLTSKLYAQMPPPYTGPTNPPPTPAQIAAQQAAIVEAEQTDFSNNYAPYVVQEVSVPSDTDSSNSLTTLSDSISASYAQQQSDVISYANATGFPLSWIDANGNLCLVDHLDEMGDPAIKTTCNLESAQTVGAQKLWPGGSTGFRAYP